MVHINVLKGEVTADEYVSMRLPINSISLLFTPKLNRMYIRTSMICSERVNTIIVNSGDILFQMFLTGYKAI